VANKYLIGIVTTVLGMAVNRLLGGSEKTTTRSGIVTVVVVNFNISLLFIQYFRDLERIKFVWLAVWALFLIALPAAYALGKGGFKTSTGTAPGIVRKIGSPLASLIIVFLVYFLVDNLFEYLRQTMKAI